MASPQATFLNQKKIVGGKNGYGAKITNIFSTTFTIETCDHVSKKKYTQVFEKNMTIIGEPTIVPSKAKPYTKVSWITDFERFGITSYSPDMISLMIRRVYDISGITDKKLQVYFNDIKLLLHFAL